MLPSTDVKRWTTGRKVALINAIAKGEITSEAVCARYLISTEELEGWRRLYENFGKPGLRVTRIKEYQRLSRRKAREWNREIS